MVKLVIANISLSLEGYIFDLAKYKPFLRESLDTLPCDSVVKIKCQDQPNLCGVAYKNYDNWEIDSQGNLKLTIYNENINSVRGKLSTKNDFSEFDLTLFNSDYPFMEETFDKLMFVVFQIRLLSFRGLNIHASAINYQNEGILFTAPSQTGKTTQARLWKQYCNASMINGDRPAVTLNEGCAYVHGSPWSGTDEVYQDVIFPIKAIVIVEQASHNVVKRLDKKEALQGLLPRVFMPYFHQALTECALDYVEKLLDTTPVYKLYCRPDKDAAMLLKEQISLLDE